MSDNLDYETYLLISPKKFIISVNTELEKKVYYEELIINSNLGFNKFEKLDFFLNQNIFKVEKKFKNFVEKIIIILDLNIFFPVEISIKKDNYDNFLNLKNLKHLLYEAQQCCKKTLDKKKVVHMLIKNYRVDNKDFSYFPENIKCHNFSLDLRLICISDDLIRDLETILKKYHISLNRVLDASYIQEFFSSDDRNIFSMAKKIIDGNNPNEVVLLDKTDKNQGFFEKFFNFFN